MTIEQLKQCPNGTKVRLKNGQVVPLRIFRSHRGIDRVDIEIKPDVFLVLHTDGIKYFSPHTEYEIDGVVEHDD